LENLNNLCLLILAVCYRVIIQYFSTKVRRQPRCAVTEVTYH